MAWLGIRPSQAICSSAITISDAKWSEAPRSRRKMEESKDLTLCRCLQMEEVVSAISYSVYLLYS